MGLNFSPLILENANTFLNDLITTIIQGITIFHPSVEEVLRVSHKLLVAKRSGKDVKHTHLKTICQFLGVLKKLHEINAKNIIYNNSEQQIFWDSSTGKPEYRILDCPFPKDNSDHIVGGNNDLMVFTNHQQPNNTSKKTFQRALENGAEFRPGNASWQNVHPPAFFQRAKDANISRDSTPTIRQLAVTSSFFETAKEANNRRNPSPILTNPWDDRIPGDHAANPRALQDTWFSEDFPRSRLRITGNNHRERSESIVTNPFDDRLINPPTPLSVPMGLLIVIQQMENRFDIPDLEYETSNEGFGNFDKAFEASDEESTKRATSPYILPLTPEEIVEIFESDPELFENGDNIDMDFEGYTEEGAATLHDLRLLYRRFSAEQQKCFDQYSPQSSETQPRLVLTPPEPGSDHLGTQFPALQKGAPSTPWPRNQKLVNGQGLTCSGRWETPRPMRVMLAAQQDLIGAAEKIWVEEEEESYGGIRGVQEFWHPHEHCWRQTGNWRWLSDDGELHGWDEDMMWVLSESSG